MLQYFHGPRVQKVRLRVSEPLLWRLGLDETKVYSVRPQEMGQKEPRGTPSDDQDSFGIAALAEPSTPASVKVVDPLGIGSSCMAENISPRLVSNINSSPKFRWQVVNTKRWIAQILPNESGRYSWEGLVPPTEHHPPNRFLLQFHFGSHLVRWCNAVHSGALAEICQAC